MASTRSVPVIDMADVESLPEKLVRACEELGCLRLKNHGVEASLMAEMKAVVRELMDLPLEMKMRNINLEEPSKGYTPPNMINAFYDGLSLYDTGSPDSVQSFCDLMEASPHQREIICKYMHAMNDLVMVMGSKLMEGLGFAGVRFEEGMNQSKMNKYNFGAETLGVEGSMLHTDAGMFTILQDDEDVNGLEVLDETTGDIISVDPLPGTFVFNIGDAGKVWSNERFRNVKHQVYCYKPKVRITIAVFVLHPKYEKVKVLEQLVSPQTPALYVPFEFEHYRGLRNSTRSSKGEALKLFRSPQQEESIK